MGKALTERKQRRIKEQKGKALFMLAAEYVSTIYGKSSKERKEIRDSFNIRWVAYCNTQNTKLGLELNRHAFKNISNNRKTLYPLKLKLWPKPPSNYEKIRLWLDNLVNR